MTTTPSKADQVAEAAGRQQAGTIPAGETALALNTGGDGDPQDPGAPQTAKAAPAPAPEEKQIPPTRGLYDDKRAEITARFREARVVELEQPDAVDNFVRSGGLPDDFIQASETAPGQAPEPAADADSSAADDTTTGDTAAAAPQTIKLNVRGKEIEVPLNEAIAKAQIAYAADDTLDVAKTKLKEVEATLAQVREMAQRAGHPVQHQNGSAQPTVAPAPAPAAPQHQEENYADLIQEIQFGDPAKAEEMLRNTIARSRLSPEQITQAVQQELTTQRFRDEGARAATVLKDFREKHAELAKDNKASAAIEATIFELQAADLQALGLDPLNLRQDGQPTTPADVAQAHLFYRAQGMNVRSPGALLEKATEDFLAWKGVKKNEPSPDDPALTRGAPRIEVNRDARKAAIQQQPSRPAAPRQMAAAPAPVRDRTSIVEQMKAQRAAKRGQTLGL